RWSASWTLGSTTSSVGMRESSAIHVPRAADRRCSLDGGTRIASYFFMPSPEIEHRNEQPAELISGVISDARDLAIAEVDKLTAGEAPQGKTVGEEGKSVSVRALILPVAAIMLGTAIALAITALGLPPWAGFGIVAVVFGLASYLFMARRRAIAKATA